MRPAWPEEPKWNRTKRKLSAFVRSLRDLMIILGVSVLVIAVLYVLAPSFMQRVLGCFGSQTKLQNMLTLLQLAVGTSLTFALAGPKITAYVGDLDDVMDDVQAEIEARERADLNWIEPAGGSVSDRRKLIAAVSQALVRLRKQQEATALGNGWLHGAMALFTFAFLVIGSFDDAFTVGNGYLALLLEISFSLPIVHLVQVTKDSFDVKQRVTAARDALFDPRVDARRLENEADVFRNRYWT